MRYPVFSTYLPCPVCQCKIEAHYVIRPGAAKCDLWVFEKHTNALCYPPPGKDITVPVIDRRVWVHMFFKPKGAEERVTVNMYAQRLRNWVLWWRGVESERRKQARDGVRPPGAVQ